MVFQARVRIGDRVFSALLGLSALLGVLLFAGIAWVLGSQAWPAMKQFGLGFLWSRSWNPGGQEFGALPYLAGTLTTSLLALAFAIPIAVGTAVALVYLLPRWISGPLGLIIELLAAVPSIVFGVWGRDVIVPLVAQMSGGSSFGPSILAAGLVLAAMILPILTTVTREMLKTVPRDQADAALALGSTPWEVTWKVVLPYAKAGILAGAILGLGRAIGETMAVILVIGNSPLLPQSPYDPGATIASLIAQEFGDPSGPLHTSTLVYLGLILLLASLLLNLLAKLVVRRLGVKR